MGLYRRSKVWWMRFTYRSKQIRASTQAEDKELAQRIYYKVLGEVAEGDGLIDYRVRTRPSGK